MTAARLRLRIALFAILCLAAGAAAAQPPDIREQLRALQGSLPAPLFEQLGAFYGLREYRAAWHDDDGPTDAARSLVTRLAAAGDEGLDPDDYLAPDQTGRPDATTVPADVLLTLGFARFASHLQNGRHAPAELDPAWYIEDDPFNPFQALTAALAIGRTDALLDSLSPPHPGYRRLRAALQRYRIARDAGGWPALPEHGTLETGSRGAEVERLRQRLAFEGETDTDGDRQLFDAALADAVRAFQRRHGLEDDGVVGPLTRAALNVDAARRTAQIRAALERWRWLPQELGARHILVNTAGQELELADPADAGLAMRVVGGRPSRPSPSFGSRVTRLVLNPPWTVPVIIAEQDLLPRQKADPGFFAANHYEVMRWREGQLQPVDTTGIDWKRYGPGRFPFTLRQRPGPHNALGRIKFDMPNRYSIYLHDTPARNLFLEPQRAFSSGCIRVEQPLELAQRLFGADPEGRLPAAGEPAGTETRIVPLPEPVPVFLAYLTAWTDPAGFTHFRPDHYGRDQGLLERFSSPAGPATAIATNLDLRLHLEREAL